MAQRIALQIEQNIVRQGWPVGELLGSEAELARRYQASRWIVREALSIVERDGLIELRRGRSGGIYIAAPALEAVETALRTYLEACHISIDEVLTVREALESLALRLASERLDPARTAELRALTQSWRTLPDEELARASQKMLRAVMSATRNPVLVIFAMVLTDLTIGTALRRHLTAEQMHRFATQVARLRSDQIDAIIGFDLPRAYQLEHDHLEASRQLPLTQPPAAAQGHAQKPAWEAVVDEIMLAAGNEASLRKTDRLRAHIQAEIAARGWPVGTVLGSESDLLARYKVSRSVLREAIRPLERLGVVEMKRGKNNGLIIGAPNPKETIKAALLFFRHAGVTQRDAEEVQTALERTAISLLARRAPADREAALARLSALLNGWKATSLAAVEHAFRTYYFALADSSGSAIVSLFMRILGDAIILDSNTRRSARSLAQTLRQARAKNEEMLEAIRAGNEMLARRLMQEGRESILKLMPVPTPTERILVPEAVGDGGERRR